MAIIGVMLLAKARESVGDRRLGWRHHIEKAIS
jgi:hypothetical protein